MRDLSGPPTANGLGTPSADSRIAPRGDLGVIAMVPDRWGPLWQPRHHVVSRLARYLPTIWFQPAPSWRDLLHDDVPAADAPAPQDLLLDSGRPWYPCIYRPAWLGARLEKARLRAAVRRLRRRGCRSIALYAWRPSALPALDLQTWDAVVYHIDDEYTFSPDELDTSPEEAVLLRRADLTLIHSESLWEKKAGLARAARRTRNGVDYASFATSRPEPPALASVPHPRIGYAGWLKDQLDWPLLEALAERHPAWSWVLLGPAKETPDTTAALERLSRRPNVHLLGAQPAAELGAWVQHFDVGIMPYRRDGYTKFIYPMKLHEYLAAGLPTVAVPLPALEPYAEIVTLADGAEQWSRALEAAIAPPAVEPAAVDARRAVARDHDWDRIAADIARQLMELCPEKPVRG